MNSASVSKVLPKRYLITPEPGDSTEWPSFLDQIKRTLDAGIELIQFRAKTLDREAHQHLAERVLMCCRPYGARLLVNAHVPLIAELDHAGIHLNSRGLMSCEARPLSTERLVAASCHDLAQIRKAESVGADFVTLSPVLPTRSHPEAEPLGWTRFLALASRTTLPVFALGGMTDDLLPDAERHGAYGIAGIRCFWRS